MKQQYHRCSCHDMLILAMVIATAAASAAAWAPLLQSSFIGLHRPEEHHHHQQEQRQHLHRLQQRRSSNNNNSIKGVHALFAGKSSNDDALSPKNKNQKKTQNKTTSKKVKSKTTMTTGAAIESSKMEVKIRTCLKENFEHLKTSESHPLPNNSERYRIKGALMPWINIGSITCGVTALEIL